MNRNNFITEFDHPEHNWKWTALEVHFINNRMQTHIEYTRAVIAERDALRKAAQMALKSMIEAHRFVRHYAHSKDTALTAGQYEAAMKALRKELGQ